MSTKMAVFNYMITAIHTEVLTPKIIFKVGHMVLSLSQMVSSLACLT